jgi:putative transposase
VRKAAGRDPEPSGAVLDSQSVQTTEQGGIRGYDAGKNVSGRKRHVLVDTLGLVLLVVITAANAQDRAAARILLSMLATRFRRLRVIWADGAYAGSGLQHWVRRLRPWGKVRLEIVRKPKGQRGFAVLPWRWIVERTFAWLGRWRRLKADYECLPEITEHSFTLPAHAAKIGADLTFSNALLTLMQQRHCKLHCRLGALTGPPK